MKYRRLSSRVKHLLFVFYLMIIVLSPDIVFGKMNLSKYPNTPEELRVLPRWCQVQILAMPRLFGNDVSAVPDSLMNERKKWDKVIGEGLLLSMHHYCAGMIWIYRYKRSFSFSDTYVEADRRTALRRGLAEFAYSKKAFKIKSRKFYYSTLMYEAFIYEEQGDIIKAANNYKEVLKLKPSYTSAYIRYANLINSIGRSADAIKVLQIGLKKTNGAKAIKQAIDAIGGAGSNN